MENTVPELKSNGKLQGTETELSQDKGTSLQTRNTVRQQEQPGSQDCALLRSFFEDKSKLQKEPESLVGRVAGKRGGNTDTMRKACDVQRQGLKKARDDGSKEPEARSASDGASVEAILSASKFRDLFSLPENCRSKRKEAIETSASKVACWLYTSNASPAIDEYVRVITADDSDREVEVEGENGWRSCKKGNKIIFSVKYRKMRISEVDTVGTLWTVFFIESFFIGWWHRLVQKVSAPFSFPDKLFELSKWAHVIMLKTRKSVSLN